jgi:hypothetical protein
MRFDARAALSVWPVDVVLGGSVFRIGPRPAIYWILHVLDDDLFGMVADGVSSDDYDRIEDGILYGDFTMEDCARSAKEAISVVSGTYWWSAIRLVATANQRADVYGELCLARVDPGQISLAAYVSAVYTVLVRNADDKQRRKLNMEIESAPSGVSAMERYDPDVAADQFEAFMASRSK